MADEAGTAKETLRVIRDDKGNEKRVYRMAIDPTSLSAILTAIGKARAAAPKAPEEG